MSREIPIVPDPSATDMWVRNVPGPSPESELFDGAEDDATPISLAGERAPAPEGRPVEERGAEAGPIANEGSAFLPLVVLAVLGTGFVLTGGLLLAAAGLLVAF